MRVARSLWVWGLLVFLPYFLLAQTSSAPSVFHVVESKMRLPLEPSPYLELPLESHAEKPITAKLYLELLRPGDDLPSGFRAVPGALLGPQGPVRSNGHLHYSTDSEITIEPGARTLNIPWPSVRIVFNQAADFYWDRLHYLIVPAEADFAPQEGVMQLGEIIPNLFRLQVSGFKHPHPGSSFPLRVRVDEPRNGKGQSGVLVQAQWKLDDDEQKHMPPVTAHTDSHGNAVLIMKIPADIESEPTIEVSAQHGGWKDSRSIDLDLRAQIKVTLSSDKPIYQPGQVLHLRVLVFGPDNHARAGDTVRVTAKGPDSDEVFAEEVKTSKFGVAQVDWQLPEKITLGDYGITAEVGDREGEGGTQVRISRYELPQFTVEPSTDKTYYLPADIPKIEVKASYLFGQPVKRGKVRIVRSNGTHWNSEKKQYEEDEQEIQQGDLDSSGKFSATLDVKNDFDELRDSDYMRYRDVRFAAYVTDLSTNRTEQKHFTVRESKERIHIYVIRQEENSAGPLNCFLTTAFPDGTPASVEVTVSALKPETVDAVPAPGPDRQEIARIHTNKYGVGRLHVGHLPSLFVDTRYSEQEIRLFLEANDHRGGQGIHSENLWLQGAQYLHITPLKSLLRAGESVTAEIESSLPDERIFVDLLGSGKVLGTQQAELHHGHAQVEFPYDEGFHNNLSIVAYTPDRGPEESDRHLTAHAEVLFPESQDLNLDVHLQRTTYKPGEAASAKFNVRSPEGRAVQSALGIVIYDKAVAERVRSDQEFGRYGFYYSDYGWDPYQSVAGVTYRDLLNRKLTGPVPSDLELLAEAVLATNNGWREFEIFMEGNDEYAERPERVFHDAISRSLKGVENLLTSRYNSDGAYPHSFSELRHMLALSGLNFEDVRDPWGMPYRAVFFVSGMYGVLEIVSSGPDKQANTHDDFTALKIERPYFGSVGRAIDMAAHESATSEGRYIHDFDTLAQRLQAKGIDLKSLKDPWGHLYALDFDIQGANYIIRVRSAGPNGVFAPKGASSSDDVLEWTSFTHYFQHETAALGSALYQHFRVTGAFPANEAELKPVLDAAGLTPEALVDPWGHPYHFVFSERSRYGDQVSISTYSAYESGPQRATNVTPVTQKVGVIEIVSYGPQNDPAQQFKVETFSRVVAEQSSHQTTPEKTSVVQVPSTGESGAISGTVTDPQGAIITGAKVTATNTYTGQQFTTTSNSEGYYLLRNLPAGQYKVEIFAQGFRSSVVNAVPVSSSNLTRVDARLAIGTTSETVEVTAQATLVETTSTQVTNTFRGASARVQAQQQAFTPRLRKYFPETLVWQPELVTDSSGRAELKFAMADNITSWKMSVIASTIDGYMGIAEKELRTFQPFFIDHEPPKVLTQGDQIELPVVLRNYLDKAQEVEVKLEPSLWFSLLSAPRQQVSVPAGEDKIAQFSISADHSIHQGKERVTAANRTTGDALERTVAVHPDGEDVSQTVAVLLAGSHNSFDLGIPANAIPGSIDAELRIYPNLGAHVLDALDAMAVRPSGCGEQITSLAFASVLVLQELRKAGQDDPMKPGNPHAELAKRAHKYISDAYQQLLNLQSGNGGFPYWLNQEPNLAVTAYVLDFMVQSSDFMKMDDSVIRRAADFLITNQEAQGGWLIHWYNNRRELDPNLTAMITRVLAEALHKDVDKAKVEPAFTKAMKFLEDRIAEWKDPYLIGQYAMAASISGHAEHTAKARELLGQLAHEEGPGMYWNLEANTSPFYSWGHAGRLETTGLAVRALARLAHTQKTAEGSQLLDRGLLYLLSHKDRYGVWYSTQASLNVLRAIVEAMPVSDESRAAGPAEILVNGKSAAVVQLPASSQISGSLVKDISSLLGPGTNKIQVRRQDDGSPLQAQVLSTHYIRWADSRATVSSNFKPGESRALRLNVAFDHTQAQVGKPVQCKVEVERIGFSGYGMMLAEIGLPPGADVDRQSLDHALSTYDVSQYEVLPDRVVLYIWPRAGGTKFSFDFKPRFGMNASTAPSILYDYYNPDARATVVPAKFSVH